MNFKVGLKGFDDKLEKKKKSTREDAKVFGPVN